MALIRPFFCTPAQKLPQNVKNASISRPFRPFFAFFSPLNLV
jgi:hypothetical protein